MVRPRHAGSQILANAKAASEALTATLKSGTGRYTGRNNNKGKNGAGNGAGKKAGDKVGNKAGKGAGNGAGNGAGKKASGGTGGSIGSGAEGAGGAPKVVNSGANGGLNDNTGGVRGADGADGASGASSANKVAARDDTGTEGFSLIGKLDAGSRIGVAGTAEDQPGWTPPPAKYDGQLHLYPGGSVHFSSSYRPDVIKNMDFSEEATNSRDPPPPP